MPTENGKIENRDMLAEDLLLQGMWVGGCRVTNGAHLELHGTVTGDLIVDEDSTATVNGMVSGDLTAAGRVQVNGTVAGRATGEGLSAAPGARGAGSTPPTRTGV